MTEPSDHPFPNPPAGPPATPPGLVQPRRHWRWLLLLLAVPLVLSFAAYLWLWFAVRQPASRDASVVTLTLPAGQGLTAISQRLQQAGLIRSAPLFQLYAWMTGRQGRLQAGDYRLPRNLTTEELLDRLTASKRKSEVSITVIEGWSNRELAAYLERAGVLSQEDFFRAVQRKAEWWDDYAFLADRPSDRDLEGYLYPDTYRLFEGTDAVSIIRKMLDNFGRKFSPKLQAEITRQGKTVHDVLTLASIVEREVPDGSDRPKVAGIFLKRLEIGMPLQSDATVNYVTGKKAARPSADDLRAESLYNTYTHRGLPPGPINNPSVSAIRAVLYPELSAYLYYLTTPDGTVIYSQTFEEHVAAKARYYP